MTIPASTILTGLNRLLSSAKVHAAAATAAGMWVAAHYAAADLPPTQRAALWIAFLGATAALVREVIAGWAAEDAAKAAAAPAVPQTQVNVGADTTNTQGTPAPALTSLTQAPPAAPYIPADFSGIKP